MFESMRQTLAPQSETIYESLAIDSTGLLGSGGYAGTATACARKQPMIQAPNSTVFSKSKMTRSPSQILIESRRKDFNSIALVQSSL